MLTSREYVLASIATHPVLVATSEYDVSAMKVFDQLFNVIGNGIRDDEELVEELAGPAVDEAAALKFITDGPIFYGYTKVKDLGGMPFPEWNAEYPGYYLRAEKHLHPTVVYWQECKATPFTPHPNFSKDYSLVYRTNFAGMSNDWKDAAIWYYTKCREYFTSDKVVSYHSAVITESQINKISDDYTKAFTIFATNEAISRAYEHPFNGDIRAFAITRWEKEFKRIIDFIDETIVMLEKMKTD